ncbi:MAG: PAS domain S-box protein, partial [Bacteroidales bacterium]|nr:PAS domain S-box protein [Bacteroidales bacterium]
MDDQSKSKEQLIAELAETTRQLEELKNSTKNSEKSLLESEKAYRLLVENNPAAIAVHSEGKIQYVNTRALELLGASKPEQIVGKPVLEFLHPDYKEIVKNRIAHIIKDPDFGKIPVEEKFIRLDGQIINLEVSAFPINYNGKKSILVVLIDITERKKAEEELKEAEGKFRELFKSVDEGVLIVDENEKIIQVNKAGANIFGCELEKMLGKNLRDFTSEEEFNKILKQTSIRQQNKPGKYELTITHDDSTTRILSCTVNPVFEDGNYKGAFGIFCDITDKKRTEKELVKAKEAAEKSEHKYRSMYDMFRLMADNSPDMFWAKDLDQKFIFANKAMCNKLLSAKDIQEPVGKTDMFFAERERNSHNDQPEWHTFGEICQDSDRIVVDSKKPQRFDEYGNVRGKFLFLDVYKAPIWDLNRKILGTVGTARIVTKEKEIERKLEENRKLLDKAQQIAKIGYYSCDLKTNKKTWSEQLFSIIGLDNNEKALSVEEMTKYIHPDDREKFQSSVGHTIKNNSVLDVTFRIFNKNGDLRHLRDIGEIVYDKKND